MKGTPAKTRWQHDFAERFGGLVWMSKLVNELSSELCRLASKTSCPEPMSRVRMPTEKLVHLAMDFLGPIHGASYIFDSSRLLQLLQVGSGHDINHQRGDNLCA